MEEPGQGEATSEVNTDTAATDMQEEFGERKEIYPVVTPPLFHKGSPLKVAPHV